MATINQKIVPHLWYDKDPERIARLTSAFLDMEKIDVAALKKA
jgi:predicted 3-demethylubiquinone-9 3-methyltransferase (glyoxalase superfamily)